MAALGQREDALASYDKSLAIDPRDAVTWFNKGNSFDAMGRSAEAIACYDKALSINRDTMKHGTTRAAHSLRSDDWKMQSSALTTHWQFSRETRRAGSTKLTRKTSLEDSLRQRRATGDFLNWRYRNTLRRLPTPTNELENWENNLVRVVRVFRGSILCAPHHPCSKQRDGILPDERIG